MQRTRLSTSVVAAVSVIMLGVSGCGSGSQTTPTGKSGSTTKFEKKSPVKIGYSAYDLANPYWQNYAAGIKEKAKAQGVSVVVADQKGAQQAQVSGSSDLINQGISALIVSPVEPNALPATVTAAHAAKIPIVVGDVGAKGDYDAFITSNNAQGGALAADYMGMKLKARAGTKKIGIITLHPGSAVGVDRVQGFKTEIKKYSDIEVVSELNGNDAIKGGNDAAANMFAAHPDLAGIYSANDNEAQGAIAAIQGAGKNPKDFVVIGFDGNAGSIAAIETGTQTATVAQDPFTQGQLAVKQALDLLNGKKVDFTDPSTRTTALKVEIVDAKDIARFKADRAGQK